jgi:hypothetical protein
MNGPTQATLTFLAARRFSSVPRRRLIDSGSGPRRKPSRTVTGVAGDAATLADVEASPIRNAATAARRKVERNIVNLVQR